MDGRPCPRHDNDRGVDQTSCTDCPAGTQTPAPGSTRCEACPADTYSDQSGVGVCPSCPDRMKSYAGANTLELCQCEIGTAQLTSTQCWPPSAHRRRPVAASDSVRRTLDGSERSHQTHDCIPGAAPEKVTEDERRRCAGLRRRGSPVAYVATGATSARTSTTATRTLSSLRRVPGATMIEHARHPVHDPRGLSD